MSLARIRRCAFAMAVPAKYVDEGPAHERAGGYSLRTRR